MDKSTQNKNLIINSRVSTKNSPDESHPRSRKSQAVTVTLAR